MYRHRTKSPWHAARSRPSITGQGVSRSEREMAAKSSISGAPSRAAPALAAVTPQITSISTPGYWGDSSITGPAMP